VAGHPVWLGVVRPHLGWPSGGSRTTPSGHMGVVRPPLRPNGNLSIWPKGQLNHPLGHWGWFVRPQTGRPGGGQTTPGQTGWPATTYGVVRPPQYIFLIFSFFFLDFFFKCDGGILGINRLNGLNCHNLKVWEVKCHILNFGGKSENEWIF
jgi:hypothetical protein